MYDVTYSHHVGNAKLQGLVTQLHLTGNKYNIALVRLVYDAHDSFLIRTHTDHVFYRKLPPVRTKCAIAEQNASQSYNLFECPAKLA